MWLTAVLGLSIWLKPEKLTAGACALTEDQPVVTQRSLASVSTMSSMLVRKYISNMILHHSVTLGVSKYGIGDLAILVAETHKFESRYCDRLLAPCTPENQHIFDSRSPMKHIDQFNCPIAFFQGDEDKVRAVFSPDFILYSYAFL